MKYRYSLAILAGSSLAAAGPCDIYASAGTPCVAAHATTRALFDSFTGSLYQVKRGSDNTTLNIAPVSAGSVANAAAQDTFCAGTTCLITQIYDQTGKGKVLTRAPKGAFSGPESDGSDSLASAIGAPVTLNGKKAYGVFISPGTGYRNTNPSGIATGDAPEGMYALFDGLHYNDGCCFDYGNGETSSTDTGNGHMEAIYYGSNTIWGRGSGNGPWVMADLENGLFSGQDPKLNSANPSVSYRFVNSIVKGRANYWAIRGGNGQSGSLSTYYNGARPTVGGYNPMSKEGSLLLGIGGDNSVSGQGTFYEGVVTATYPTDATENLVQANIVAAKYATTSLNTAPLTIGQAVSFRATTSGYTDRYISHSGSAVTIAQVSSSSTAAARGQASFYVRQGLGSSDCYSFESKDTPGSYIRHASFVLRVDASAGTKLFNEDATFCSQTGLNGGNSLRSWSYPAKYIRHYATNGYLAANGGPFYQDAAANFNADASFTVTAALG